MTLDFDQVGIKAPDPHTLEITLEQPTPFFMHLAGFSALSPVPRHSVEKYGYPQWLKPGHLISNGAYRLLERRMRDRVRMVKNEHYWDRDHVAINTVDVLATESAATALNMYLTGAVDWIPSVPPIVVAELLAERRPDFHTSPELTVNFYRFNVTEPPLDNVLVRRALAMAVDRQEIVDRVTRGGELPAHSLVPPGLEGYQPAVGPRFDLTMARKLLTEAGFPEGRGLPAVKILYNQDDTHEAVAQLIQDQWKRNLGVDATLQNLEWGSFLSAVNLMQYKICRSGWVGDYPDPNTFLDLFVSGGANNSTGWSWPPYDELLRQAAAETDAPRRFELLHQAEQVLLDNMPVMPLYFRVSRNMVQPRVQGFTSNLLDQHPLRSLSLSDKSGAAATGSSPQPR